MRSLQCDSRVRASLVLTILLLGALLLPRTAAASKCTAAKYKAVGTAAQKKAKCKAKAVRKSAPVDVSCLAKAEAKLALQLSKADAKGDCLTTGDASALATIVDTFVSQTMNTLEPPPPSVACCALSGGICLVMGSASAQLCVDAGGAPGAAGEVCDAATGTCQPPPSNPGPCCEAGSCFSGPGVDGPGCAELVGSFSASATCLANQTCAAP